MNINNKQVNELNLIKNKLELFKNPFENVDLLLQSTQL
jgi:hypothetical protein